MSKFRWIKWTQPILKSNTDYGVVSASMQNSSVSLAWKALDGIKEGTTTSWESYKDSYPASWTWKLPVTLKISKIVLYNKYSSRESVTKNVSVYADENCTKLIGKGTFECKAFSEISIPIEEEVITNCICIVCEDSYLNENTYVGLGEVEISAEEGIEQFCVRFYDWNGVILKEEYAEKGMEVLPPDNPVRKGYSFVGWDIPTVRITQDVDVTAMYERLSTEESFLLTTLNDLFNGLMIPIETGVFKNKAPDRYVVLTPILDKYEIYADNRPETEIQEVRISLYDKGNYLKLKNTISRLLLGSDITITQRRFIGREDNTGYYHYAIDVAKNYETEE